jgi:heme-degrading monooxygenase HmoA
MPAAGAHVTLSFFRYTGFNARLWGTRQMAEMRKPLAAVPGLRFFKLLGTGGGSGYGFWPDFGTYALLGSWASHEDADRFHAGHAAHAAWRAHSAEVYTLHLRPASSRGQWSGVNPFAPQADAPDDAPLAILTRATIKPGYVIGFWQQVARVARSLQGREGLLFTKGVGELPWVEQATFSVWRSRADMMAFAHAPSTPHAQAVRRTRQAAGFSEELYARFSVVSTEGSWHGRNPVQDGWQGLAEPRTESAHSRTNRASTDAPGCPMRTR